MSRLFHGAFKRSFPRMNAGASTTNRLVSSSHADSLEAPEVLLSRTQPSLQGENTGH